MKSKLTKANVILTAILLANAAIFLCQIRQMKTSSVQRTDKIFHHSYLCDLENYGRSLSPDIRVSQKEKDATDLKSLLAKGTGKVLVLRVSDTYCNSCVQSIVDVIKRALAERGIEHMLVIGHKRNELLLKHELRELGLKGCPYANLLDLGIPADKRKYPYLFILDKDLRVSGLFVPEKGQAKATEEYLELALKLIK